MKVKDVISEADEYLKKHSKSIKRCCDEIDRILEEELKKNPQLLSLMVKALS